MIIVNKAEKIPNEYYWIRKKGSDWFIGKHDPQSYGGWTNDDCWEDFDSEIIDYVHIPKPFFIH
jgi:hypothetical protein